jgi:O-antigen/teichoic acid export membrane protein
VTTAARPDARLVRLLRSSAGIAVAMAVMSIGTYAFQLVAARLLGPSSYGAVASLLALLLVASVVQLGIQATAARRIAATPEDAAAIEQTVLSASWRAAWALGALSLLATPLVVAVLRLDSAVPAVLFALCVMPVTVMGGQAGVLQGERRWLALSLVYLAAGVPRVVFGVVALVVSPTVTAAMVAVLAGWWAPVLVGVVALRGRPVTGAETPHDREVRADLRREAAGSSIALLAFMALSSLDILVARNVLDDHQAGLYAGGLIVTKAVLFLPQFAVVILFPSMSTVDESRTAVVRGLSVLTVLGALSVAGAWLLSGVALVFVGGEEYADVQGELWLFALIGALLTLLQLLVYAGLAKRGRTTKWLVAVGVVAMVGLGLAAHTLVELAVRVATVDAVVLGLLLLLQAFRHRRG